MILLTILLLLKMGISSMNCYVLQRCWNNDFEIGRLDNQNYQLVVLNVGDSIRLHCGKW